MRNAAVLGLALLLLAPVASATPVELPAAACRLLESCRMVGQGTLRWWGFHVYDAALWSRTGRWQDQITYALDIRYARRVSGAQLAQTSVDEMRRLGAGDESALARWGAAMRRLMDAIAESSQIIHRMNDSSAEILISVEEQISTSTEISGSIQQTSLGASNIANSISELARGSSDVSKSALEGAHAVTEVSANIQGISNAARETNSGAQQVKNSAN